jgi:hypothetical protein
MITHRRLGTGARILNLDAVRANRTRERRREVAAAIRSIDARMDLLLVEIADLELERRALERGECLPRRRR